MDFEVIINDAFSALTTNQNLSTVKNKRVLSLINDFENGLWRFDKFQKFIWNNIKETALSYRERAALINEGEDSILTESAKKLRLTESDDDIGKGSELAEIVLYGIMKHHYKALPIVPKIFYKQNSQDNAKGADSIHIVIEGPNKFSLWLGESKFYTSIENAKLKPIVDSVKESLTLEKLKKENSIITSLSDINDFTEISDELRQEIFNLLSTKVSIDKIKPILNIPILLLHECSITKATTHSSEKYKSEIIEYHKERATAYFQKQMESCKDVDLYSEIKFHIILFPVAEKKKIVEKFISKAKVYKE